MIAGRAIQMLILCIMHTIKYTCYKKESYFIEYRPTTTTINEIALADDSEFTGMIHVNKDGLLTFNTETLQLNNGTTNIIHGMKHVLVILIKPVDEQPRRRNLTLMLFNLYDIVMSGCFISKFHLSRN